MRYRFGRFELDVRTGELRKEGRRLRLPGRAFRALALLLQNAGEVVSREELKRRIWPDEVHVEFEHGLNNAIHRIREALGDARNALETLPRQGYRFLGEVETIPAEEAPRGVRSYALAGLALAAVAFALFWFSRDALDPGAREAELRGNYFLAQKTPESVKRSLESFEQALALAPNLASAHAGRARAYHFLAALGAIDRGEARRETAESAARALELDPSCGPALAILAESRFRFSDRREGVESLFLRALELEPGAAETHQWYGNFLAIEGRIEDGLREMERARALDPLSLHINSDLGALLYEAGFRGKAMAQFERALELDPDYPKTHFLLGHVHLAEGNVEEAIASFERSVALSPDTPKYREALEAAAERETVAHQVHREHDPENE
jgi:DNA-binding winged helix-turn-helix (wHTH) protein/Tfp pilus assembly protein PilF